MTYCRVKTGLTALWLLLPFYLTAQTTVAVGDFENRTDHLYFDAYAEKIPDLLAVQLSRSKEIVLVARKNLQSIVDEQSLSMTGLVDTSNAQEVGRLLRARYVITGVLSQAEGRQIAITARIINVKSGKMVSEQVEGPSKQYLPDMIELLAENLLHQLTGEGAHQTEMRLTRYPTKPFLWSTAACGILTLTFHRLYNDRRETYQNETRLAHFDSRYKAANSMYHLRNTSGILTGIGFVGTVICWANNLKPQKIQASGPRCSPYVFALKNETVVGVVVHF